MTQRKLGLLEAVSLNMSLMVGIGPFITIPLLLATMGGPQAMIGWVLGAVLAICDGMVWSELAAAFPGAGGTYHYYDAVYGQTRVGRLLKFLFVWQFLFSGPMEVATGAIGLALYLGYFFPSLSQTAWNWGSLLPLVDLKVLWGQVAAIGVTVVVTALAYRRITAAGRLMVVFWVGMLATVAWVIFTGLTHFNPSIAFDFPENAWKADGRWMLGLGMALGIAMYDYLGYYQICYLGEEVADIPTTVPRAILISTIGVSLIYLVMNVSILGVLPWREVLASNRVATDLILRIHGEWAASIVTVMIIWTAMASAFAAILGYSRIPYASARAGHFFRFFAATHPRGDFPHRSLLLVGGISMLACLADLPTVITVLLTSRILIQFIGQIATLAYWRSRPDRPRLTFVMPLYPLPLAIATAGWMFIFATSTWDVVGFGVGSLVLGIIVFAIWDGLRGPPENREDHADTPAGAVE